MGVQLIRISAGTRVPLGPLTATALQPPASGSALRGQTVADHHVGLAADQAVGDRLAHAAAAHHQGRLAADTVLRRSETPMASSRLAIAAW